MPTKRKNATKREINQILRQGDKALFFTLLLLRRAGADPFDVFSYYRHGALGELQHEGWDADVFKPYDAVMPRPA